MIKVNDQEVTNDNDLSIFGPVILFCKKYALKTIIALIGLNLLFSSMGTIGSGQRGVIVTLGAVSNRILNEGFYFKIPWIQTVSIVDVRILKEQVESSAASKDLQIVESVVALNYNISPESVAKLFQSVGPEYKIRIIDPSLQEAVKAGTAKYNAEELITKREIVKEDIKTIITNKLKDFGILVNGFNIINFNFSRDFNDAVEMKVTAEQNALASKNKLEQIKFEAQGEIVKAQGKAQAMRIESQAISSNPQILTLRAIEMWDGALPQVMSGAIPFINLKTRENKVIENK